MTPTVSIILPVYNHGRYVEQAIESVVAQTVGDWELLVIDDGSTDDSAERVRHAIARWHLALRTRFIEQANQGSHATINCGLHLARGAYLTILNSDDVYAPGRLQHLLQAAQAARTQQGVDTPGQEALLSFSAVRLIDEHGHVVGPGHPRHWWMSMYRDMRKRWRAACLEHPSAPDVMAQALLWGNLLVSTSNMFMSRALWQRLGAFRHYRYVLDWDYGLRAAIAQPQAVTFIEDQPLLDYRLHGGNTILTGALRNHLEAARILRQSHADMARRGWPVQRPGLLRLKYLDRFIRQESRRVLDTQIRSTLASHLQAYEAAQDPTVAAEFAQGQVPALPTLLHTLKLEHHRLTEQIDAQGQQHAQVLERMRSEQTARMQALERNHALALQAERERHREEKQSLLDQQAQLTHAHSDAQRELALVRQSEAGWKAQAEQTAQVLSAVRASTSWRLTAPLRALTLVARHTVARLRRRLAALRPTASRVATQVAAQVAHTTATTAAVLTGQPRPAPLDAYDQWLQVDAQRVQRLGEQAPGWLAQLKAPPLVSVVVPAFNTDPTLLRALIASLQAQFYPHWELCLVDDASTDPASIQALEAAVSAEPRIRLHRRRTNGHIGAATQDGVAMAGGDWVAFVDHDDELPPHALLRLIQHAQQHPEFDVLYSDEDKIDLHGRRSLPLFKPDWSPALLWTQNYIGHLVCVRHQRLQGVGGLDLGFDGSQDHDLMLRLASDGARFGHVPDVLYHWRLHPASTSARADAKPYAHQAGQRAVERHLRQRYPQHFSHLEDGPHAFVYQPRFKRPADTLVSLIIPTRDRLDLLKPCIDSIVQHTVGVRFELVIIDNGSCEASTLDYLAHQLPQTPRCTVLRADVPFNWSALNNLGVRHASGQVLVFLNNDTLVITPDWLDRLSEFALLPDVGTVGALLLFEDSTIQHAGVVVGMGGWADHVYRTAHPVNYPSPFIASVVMRNVLASTGACVAISRAAFDRLGGFDEAFEICGSDVELGLRAHKAGLQNIYLPSVRLHHLESKTRTPHVPPGDFVQSELKYAPYRLEGDPFYNPNLDPYSAQPRALHPEQGRAA